MSYRKPVLTVGPYNVHYSNSAYFDIELRLSPIPLSLCQYISVFYFIIVVQHVVSHEHVCTQCILIRLRKSHSIGHLVLILRRLALRELCVATLGKFRYKIRSH